LTDTLCHSTERKLVAGVLQVIQRLVVLLVAPFVALACYLTVSSR